MNELERGATWELAGGKRVDIIDRAFISSGKRWVAVEDHDFDEPRLIEVARFEGARELWCACGHSMEAHREREGNCP